jgi:hypothetical protein
MHWGTTYVSLTIVEGDRASAVEMPWYGVPFARGDRVP